MAQLDDNRAIQNLPTTMATITLSEEEKQADVDEPPDLDRTPRPSRLKLDESFTTSFSKSTPARSERKESLLTNALHSDSNSSVEERTEASGLRRDKSSASTWSNNSISTAELTSDGGFTSAGTRASTPSPPLPPSSFRVMTPILDKKPRGVPLSIVQHEDENIGPLQKPAPPSSGEHDFEASLGRKRCITFACGGRKDAPKPTCETPKPEQKDEPQKRVCTIKFACPTKVSTDAPSTGNKPRMVRPVSPAPQVHRSRASPKAKPRSHRDSDSTVRNHSPVSTRKQPATKGQTRPLSLDPDLAHSEAFRFHEFASSEEQIDEWLQESTCHRSRLTISDTLKIENNLRQLGEEVEEEALDDEEEDLDEEAADNGELDDEEDDDLLEDDDDDDEQGDEDDVSDEGFLTDDEGGFAVSDDESDAESDFNWWAPGAYSTAAISIEHMRPSSHRSLSESSVGSIEGERGFKMPEKRPKRKKSRPVNILVPSPELPDSTDFVCGTLDEDRPLEDAYLTCLERRRAAKHKITPQDIDPTFPTSDPEMDEEDEDDEPDHAASESDQYLMMHGQMDPLDNVPRGRNKSASKKRSPAHSPKRLRSPPPSKRGIHRSPPPRKLFSNSPKRPRSPAPGVRLRSPPPTRRESHVLSPPHQGLSIRFAGLTERPPLTISSSLPRTPVSVAPPEDLEDEDTCREQPVRRAAIDIKIGLENKRLRRKEQQYKKIHRKGCKEKEKRSAPGKGLERMREMGLGLAAHRGKPTGFAIGMPPTPDQKDMHVLSV